MVNGPGVWGQDATHRSSSLTWHAPVPISVASSAPVASEHPSWDTTATPRRSTTACSGPSLVATSVAVSPGRPAVTRDESAVL